MRDKLLRNGAVFGYNARSEVTHDGSIGAWYSYDEIGNQTDYAVNELNQYIETSYSYSGETVEEYSPDGEMLAYGSWRYCYYAKSRLVSVLEWRYSDLDNP